MIFVEYFKFLIQKHFEKQNLISNVLYFKDIHDVEFEVRTGPFPGDNQRCKLTCVKGQWVGPLCRTKESKKPLHTVWTVNSVQRMYTGSSHNVVLGTGKKSHQVNFALSEYSPNANLFN